MDSLLFRILNPTSVHYNLYSSVYYNTVQVMYQNFRQNREMEYYVTDYNAKPLPGSPRVEYSRYSKTSKTTLRSTASTNDWNSEWKPWAIWIFLGVLIIIIIIGSKDNVGQFKGTRSVLIDTHIYQSWHLLN